MANPTFHGLEFRWSTNGVSSTAFGSALIQTIDNEEQLKEVEVLNQLGNTAIWVGHDFKKMATFEMVPASNTTSDGNLSVTPYKPTQGTMIAVVDSIDGTSDINGANWIVLSTVERRNVTGALTITARVVAYPLITT